MKHFSRKYNIIQHTFNDGHSYYQVEFVDIYYWSFFKKHFFTRTSLDLTQFYNQALAEEYGSFVTEAWNNYEEQFLPSGFCVHQIKTNFLDDVKQVLQKDGMCVLLTISTDVRKQEVCYFFYLYRTYTCEFGDMSIDITTQRPFRDLIEIEYSAKSLEELKKKIDDLIFQQVEKTNEISSRVVSSKYLFPTTFDVSSLPKKKDERYKIITNEVERTKKYLSFLETL